METQLVHKLTLPFVNHFLQGLQRKKREIFGLLAMNSLLQLPATEEQLNLLMLKKKR